MITFRNLRTGRETTLPEGSPEEVRLRGMAVGFCVDPVVEMIDGRPEPVEVLDVVEAPEEPEEVE